MMAEGEERDVYVHQLQEVFLSCATDGQDTLDQGQLQELCIKLQVEGNADKLVEELLASSANGRVGFAAFKDGFVKVLSEMDNLGSEDEEEENLEFGETDDQKELIKRLQELSDFSDKEEAEPKYTSGEKRYGRRSRPPSRCEDESPLTTSDLPEVDAVLKLPVSNQRRSSTQDGQNHNDETEGDMEAVGAETFEAEGQLNQAMSSMENALDPLSEEEHLREIWRELKVGANGALSQPELVAVCQHIGMEEMNEEEMQHLFNKLDVDGDGQVSFQEFLQGLFQHGGPTNPPTPVSVSRTLSTPRQKLKLSISMDERTHTPSFTSTESGLFSVIDPEGSGYAMPDAIVEAWENLGVPQGGEILEYLQFEKDTKVSLGELSSVLEQEARSVEDDNATYQAAIASFVMEIRHLKTAKENMTAQRDKLQIDLIEANTRIGNLVKEEDERTANFEKSREREMMDIEKRHQDQVKLMINESESEKETLIQQTNKQRQKLEAEIERLKEEETRMKERLNEAEKDIEKLEKETVEMAGICNELEDKCMRQQRELDLMPELHRKLEEMESNREVVQDEQHKFQAQRLQFLESENKDLKDRTDELTMQVEDLKQQLSGTRRRSKTPRLSSGGTSVSTKRSGSILSDYTKPTIFIRRSYTSDNSDDPSDEEKDVDEASLSSSGRQRRLLPQLPSDVPNELSETPIEELRQQVQEETEKRQEMEEALKAEIRDLEAGYKAEIHELREGFERERKEIEQAYKMEITAIEEEHQREKQEVLSMLSSNNDPAKEKEFETRLKIAKEGWEAEKEMEMENRMEEVKRDALIKAESEKNLIIHQHETEKKELTKKKDEEIETEVKSRLEAREEMLKQEVMQMLEDDSVAMTTKVSQQLEEAEERFSREKKEKEEEHKKKEEQMREQFEREKKELQDRFNNLQTDHETVFSEGIDGLQGKLKRDFERLVDKRVFDLRGEVAREKELEISQVEKKSQREMEDKVEKEKEKLKEEMENKLQVEKRKMEIEMEKEMGNKLQVEKRKMEIEMEKEIEKVKQDRKTIDEEIKKIKELEKDKIEIARREERMKVEKEMEKNFTSEKEKSNLEVRHELEKEIIKLQGDLHNEEIMNLELEHYKLKIEDQTKERERQELKILQLEKRIAELENQVEEEKRKKLTEVKDLRQSLLRKYREEVMELEGRVEEETRRSQSLREELTLRQLQEKTAQHENGAMTIQLSQEIKQEMEMEFLSQLDQLKSVLGDEKKELEAQVKLLQQELDDMTKASDSDQRIHQKVVHKARENEERLKKQIEELKNSLEQSKSMESKLKVHADQLLVNLEKEKQHTGSHIEKNFETREKNFLISSKVGLDSPDNRDQVKYEQWETERDLLKGQLYAAENRSAEANTALSLAQSEYIRELRTLRENINNMVDIGRYNALNAQLTEAQSRVRELESALEERSRDTTKMIGDAFDDNKKQLRQAEDEKEEMRRKLTNLQHLLDETMTRLKQQLERCAKTDLLVKDLYLENADLMEQLYETEKRQKDAYNRVYKLEQKCRALEIFVKKITAAALE